MRIYCARIYCARIYYAGNCLSSSLGIATLISPFSERNLPDEINYDIYLSIDLIKQYLYNVAMDIFFALADPTRRKIVELLASSGPLTATEICSHFTVSSPAISQHLKVLREARLVQMEKQAQQRIYCLDPASMHDLEDWASRLERLWTERFAALDRLLASEKARISNQ